MSNKNITDKDYYDIIAHSFNDNDDYIPPKKIQQKNKSIMYEVGRNIPFAFVGYLIGSILGTLFIWNVLVWPWLVKPLLMAIKTF